MTYEEEQYLFVDRLLFDAKGNGLLTTEEYFRLTQIAMYWLEQMKPNTKNVKGRMLQAIVAMSAHQQENKNKEKKKEG